MLTTTLVIFSLLIIASLVHHLAKLIKIPYTILLFIVGIFLVVVDNSTGWGLTSQIVLTPELLFFVFLPVLIFEAWYHIKYKQLTKNYVTIWSLALVWFALSTGVIGVGWRRLMNQLGIPMPIEVMLLFGVIISSTDPVAVLAIFKDLWVPKRLWLIFEWESLFNDGIAVAVFLVMIEIFRKGEIVSGTWIEGVVLFVMMVVWGIALGIIFWLTFSQLIKYIKNNEHVEITLTMVLAHVVFLLSEYITHHVEIWGFDIKVSWVIATAYAAIIMWNYGKTKISPKVEAYMDKFWSFFSFVTNSLVFLMMGMMVQYLDIPLIYRWKPLLVCLFVLVIWRAVAVYLPLGILNALKLHEHIPLSRQHVLNRWSLRWALALMLVLLIPNDFMVAGRPYEFHPKAFILIVTIWSIMFSLILQWLTIKPLVKRLNINWLVDLERFEHLESHILVYHKIIEKIKSMHSAYEISPENYDALIQKYQSKITETSLQTQIFLQQLEHPEKLLTSAITLHALGIEKEYLHDMYAYNEVPEQIYHERKAKIEKQIARVEAGLPQIRGFKTSTDISPVSRYPIERIVRRLHTCKNTHHNEYIIERTKYILCAKVIENLEALKKIDFGYDSIVIQRVIDLYKKFHDNARREIQELVATDNDVIERINTRLLNKWLMRSEEKLIKDLYHKEMITQKIYQQFMEEIDEEVWKGY